MLVNLYNIFLVLYYYKTFISSVSLIPFTISDLIDPYYVYLHYDLINFYNLYIIYPIRVILNIF